VCAYNDYDLHQCYYNRTDDDNRLYMYYSLLHIIIRIRKPDNERCVISCCPMCVYVYVYNNKILYTFILFRTQRVMRIVYVIVYTYIYIIVITTTLRLWYYYYYYCIIKYIRTTLIRQPRDFTYILHFIYRYIVGRLAGRRPRRRRRGV
jgi:hypothetical protein